MIYSPITLPIIWRCRVRVEYPGTVGLVVRHLCMSLSLHALRAAPPGVCRQRRCSSQQQSCVDRRAALVVLAWTHVAIAAAKFRKCDCTEGGCCAD